MIAFTVDTVVLDVMALDYIAFSLLAVIFVTAITIDWLYRRFVRSEEVDEGAED